MTFLKIYYHCKCWIKLLLFYLIYGKRIHVPLCTSFRKGFHLVIENQGTIYIGREVFFNNYCTLAAREYIKIDEGTIFGENVKVYDHNHVYSDTDVLIKNQGYTSAPIHIGKHCWIGSNVTILKGVTIGDKCVIGAGCVVYKDVPVGTILMNKQEWIEKKIGMEA